MHQPWSLHQHASDEIPAERTGDDEALTRMLELREHVVEAVTRHAQTQEALAHAVLERVDEDDDVAREPDQREQCPDPEQNCLHDVSPSRPATGTQPSPVGSHRPPNAQYRTQRTLRLG